MSFQKGNRLGIKGRPKKYTTQEEVARNRTASSWKYQGIVNKDGSLFTPMDFDRAYQIQQGCCLGCKKHASELKRALAVDHNHTTKIFRGLLCISCNLILGFAKDNIDIFKNLADYLEDGKSNE